MPTNSVDRSIKTIFLNFTRKVSSGAEMSQNKLLSIFGPKYVFFVNSVPDVCQIIKILKIYLLMLPMRSFWYFWIFSTILSKEYPFLHRNGYVNCHPFVSTLCICGYGTYFLKIKNTKPSANFFHTFWHIQFCTHIHKCTRSIQRDEDLHIPYGAKMDILWKGSY